MATPTGPQKIPLAVGYLAAIALHFLFRTAREDFRLAIVQLVAAVRAQ